MKLIEHIKLYYPSIIEEYIQYLDKSIPQVGETVITLRNGFGGIPGRKLIVKKISEESITLTDGDNNYISMKENWYMDIKLEE